MGLFHTFFYIDIPVIYHVYLLDIHGISLVYQYKKRYWTNPLYFTWYIPYICKRTQYAFDIHGIYHVYTMYLNDSLGYTWYIPWISMTYTTMNLFVYIWLIPYIYIVYTSIYHKYTLNMYGIYMSYACYTYKIQW